MGGVLVVGTIMIDVIAPLIDEFKPGANYIVEVESCYGGGGANVAYHLALMGDRVGLVGGLGLDPLGHSYEEYLKTLGIELYLARSHRTGMLVGLTFNNGDRSFLADPGANTMVNRELVESAIDSFNPDIVVIHGYLLPIPEGRDAAVKAAEAAANSGATLLFDPAYYNMSREELEAALEILNYSNVITPNEAEAQTLASINDPVKASQILTEKYNVIVYLKMGSRGAALITKKRVEAQVKPPPVKVVNSVGSGDTFTAVVAHGLLNKLNPHEILRKATHLASQTAACKCPQCSTINGSIRFTLEAIKH